MTSLPYHIIRALVLCQFASSEPFDQFSSPTDNDKIENYGEIKKPYLTSVLLYLAAAMMLVCPLLMFCGYRVYKVTMFVFGGLICGIPVFIVEMTKDTPANEAYEAFCLAFVCGGIMLGVCLVRCGMGLVSALLGACGGAVVGVGGYYLARSEPGPILGFVERGQVGALASLFGLAFVGALAGIAFERLIVICLASAVGSFFTVLAWDCALGWRAQPLDFVGGFVVCTLISSYVQCRVTGRLDDGYGGDGNGNGTAVNTAFAAYVHPRDRPLLPTCAECQGYCNPGKKNTLAAKNALRLEARRQQNQLSSTGLSLPCMRPSSPPTTMGLSAPLLGNDDTPASATMHQSTSNVGHRADPTDFRGAFWGRPPRRGERRAVHTAGSGGVEKSDVEHGGLGGEDGIAVEDDADDTWFEVNDEGNDGNDAVIALDGNVGSVEKELDNELEKLLLEASEE